MPTRKHDWFNAELTYITGKAHTDREWECNALINAFTKLDESMYGKPGTFRKIGIEYSKHRKGVTLKTISELYNIPYQSVRRYAAKKNWRLKRIQFQLDLDRKVREKIAHYLQR